jgi:hypothetical protein
MNLDERIRTALTPIVPVVKPNVHTGSETEYIVFNYSELPTLHADNRPHAIRYLVQVHWYLPTNANPNTKKKQIKQALLNADFTYPSTTNASDGEGQHFVFEMEYCDGDV